VGDARALLPPLGFVVGGCAIAVATVAAMPPELRFRRKAIRTTGRVVGRERGGTLLRWVDYESLGVRFSAEASTAQDRHQRAVGGMTGRWLQ
jgi:hypothetical protein